MIHHLQVLPLFLYFWVYNIIGLQRVYQVSWLQAAVKGTIMVASLLALLFFYRQFITIWAVESL